MAECFELFNGAVDLSLLRWPDCLRSYIQRSCDRDVKYRNRYHSLITFICPSSKPGREITHHLYFKNMFSHGRHQIPFNPVKTRRVISPPVQTEKMRLLPFLQNMAVATLHSGLWQHSVNTISPWWHQRVKHTSKYQNGHMAHQWMNFSLESHQILTLIFCHQYYEDQKIVAAISVMFLIIHDNLAAFQNMQYVQCSIFQ